MAKFLPRCRASIPCSCIATYRLRDVSEAMRYKDFVALTGTRLRCAKGARSAVMRAPPRLRSTAALEPRLGKVQWLTRREHTFLVWQELIEKISLQRGVTNAETLLAEVHACC